MSDFLKSLIQDQINFYSEKGYQFYIQTSLHYNNLPYHSVVIKHINKKFNNDAKTTQRETTDANEISEHIAHLNSFKPDDDKNRWDFFLHVHEKYPKKLKQLMSMYVWLTDSYVNKSYAQLFNYIAPTYEDVFKIIKCWSVGDWSIATVPLEGIDKILKDRKCPEDVANDFWIKFLKDRKAQLKDVKNGPMVRKFLLQKYDHNEEKLQPFFEFFPILATVFQELPADVFEELPPITNSVIINTKKMRQTFLVDGFKEDSYKHNTEKFGKAFKDYFELDHFEFVFYDTTNRMYQLNFHHHNPDITDDKIKQYIVDFYRQLKRDPTMNVEEKNLLAWISQNELHHELPAANNIKRKTVKI